MAEEKKDNFLLIVGVCAVLSISLVVLLKGRETEHLQMGPSTTADAEAQVLEKARDFNNVMVE